MKKIFSILALLLLLVALYPQKVEANVEPISGHEATTVSTENYRVYICDGYGNDCFVSGVLVQ